MDLTTLDGYQKQSLKTALTQNENPKDDLPRYVLGIVDEAGEVAGKMKKRLRGDEGYQDDNVMRAHMLGELGDVLWYVAVVARLYDLDLSTVAQYNAEKLSDRNERDVLRGDGDER